MDRYEFRDKIHEFLSDSIESFVADLTSDPTYSDGFLMDMPETIDGQDTWELYVEICDNEIDWSTV